jgi:GNAT superfamily N-acetyltransferase
MNFFKLFSALFLLISAPLVAVSKPSVQLAIDITQEFCKTTQTPKATCAQLQAFMWAYGSYMRVELQSKADQKNIGKIELTKRNNGIEIDILRVYSEFQKQGHGGRLLKYGLAQCGDTCNQVELFAYPFTTPDEEKPDAFNKLKKFYHDHGGEVVRQHDSGESADMIFTKDRISKDKISEKFSEKDDRFINFLRSYL